MATSILKSLGIYEKVHSTTLNDDVRFFKIWKVGFVLMPAIASRQWTAYETIVVCDIPSAFQGAYYTTTNLTGSNRTDCIRGICNQSSNEKIGAYNPGGAITVGTTPTVMLIVYP